MASRNKKFLMTNVAWGAIVASVLSVPTAAFAQDKPASASVTTEAKKDEKDTANAKSDGKSAEAKSDTKGVTGKAAEQSLGRAFITCNKNGIPFDPAPFTITSGIRLGTPAGTTRGFGPAEFKEVGALINEVIDGLAKNGEGNNGKVEKAVAAKVKKLTAKFPIY